LWSGIGGSIVMDYKKIIINQNMRLKILELLNFIDDEIMVKLQYRIALGRKLDLKQPKRYTEKLQWYKLYYRDPLMTQCADKYGVREYVKGKGYKDILVPLLGVYDNVEKIDFAKLPDKFVLKTTNGSHTNLFCEDKNNFDISGAKQKLHSWVNRKQISPGREWAYHDIKPRIICESYLEKDMMNDLVDYKFFCFNGKAYCLFVIIERFLEGGMKLGIYDMEFEQMPYFRCDVAPIRTPMKKPENFYKMVEIAEALAKDFPHVRVDLYNIDGKIYFGELTFYHGSGYMHFHTDEFDFILGRQFILPNKLLLRGEGCIE